MRESAGGVVAAVAEGSLAAEAGIEAGDAILEIDGRALRDAVDYRFLAAEAGITARFRKADGREDLILFEKHPDEDLGLAFERATWDGVTVCDNQCFFCFLKGLPKGLRKPLYLKDDDYRLSFLHGNFVTLTNLTEDDWARLEEQRLSPLNVSVHATDPALRRRLLGNPRAPDVTGQLERLGALGLRAHTQIVLTPGVNDGEALERSLRDLTALHPTVLTVSVVPVGASPRLEERALERDGVVLPPPERDYARRLIAVVRRHQRACEAAHGRAVVQCADEYYLAAGVPPPAARRYDGFPQYENGIGMTRWLLDDWRRLRRRLRARPDAALAGRRAALACGTLIAPVLARLAAELRAETGVDASVHPVPNDLFGERVNVSGLLPGEGLARALAGVKADLAALPRTSLDYFGERFLDGLTAEELAARVDAPVAFASTLSEVVEALREGPAPPAPASAPNGAFWSEPDESPPANPHAAE